MSCKVENGTLVIRTRKRNGQPARDEAWAAFNEFMRRLDSPPKT